MRLRRSSSSSSIGSATSSQAEATTQQIFVKLLSHEIIPMNIPCDTTISTLVQLLSLRSSASPAAIRLVYAGRHLTTTKLSPSTSPQYHPEVSPLSYTANATLSHSIETLASLAIPPNATLHVTLPILGGMPPKKQRCEFKDCKDAAQRIVGDCSFCNGHYCGKHRMLEEHWCKGLEDCKAEGRERNKNTLEAERTMVRGV